MNRFLRVGSALGLFFVFGCSSGPKVDAPTTDVSSNIAVNRDPADITKVGDGDYRIEWCGNSGDAGKGFSLVINGGSKDGAGGKVNSSGCIKYTFRDGRVTPGDNIVYQIDGQNRASETVPGSNGGNSGGTSPQPVLQKVDLNKVSNEAENRARCTANAVVNIYGKFESYRYNFSRGFREGIRRYDFSNLGSLRQSPDYRNGYQSGSIEGQNDGAREGSSNASQSASRQASMEVRSRYAAIVDRDANPDLTLTLPSLQYEGGTPSLRQPIGVEERIGNLEDEYRREVQQNSFSYEGSSLRWDIWRQEWTLGYSYHHDYSNELVRSWYREDWAFDLYRRGDFSRCSDGVEYYDRIRNSNLYSNASEAAGTYRRSFKREYDQVIDGKWWNEVSREYYSARQAGLGYGWRVAREYAHDLGYDNGYRVGFSESSREAYAAKFGIVYKDVFDSEIKRYETTAVFEADGLGIYTDGKDPYVHAVGMPVSAVLTEVINLGRQPGRLSVSVVNQAQGMNDVLAIKSQDIEMKASSSLPHWTKVGPIGIISPSLDPNAKGTINVRVANRTLSANFNTDWKALIAAIPTANPTAQKTQLDYVFRFVDIEIKNNAGGMWSGNPWETENEDKLLKQAALLVQKMPAEQKVAFAPLVEKVKKSMGKKPSGLFGNCNKKCQAWESVQNWLNRML